MADARESVVTTGADAFAWEPASCLCGLTGPGRPLFAVPHDDAPGGRTFVVQCDCGLRRLDPRPTATTVARYYAEASGYHAYTGRLRSPLKQALWNALRDSEAAPAVRPLWVRLASPLLRPLARWQFDVNVRLNGRGLRVLDVGSGFGDVLMYLQSRGCRTLGIDLSADAAERAREYGIDVRVGTMQSLQLPPGDFDVVIMSHSLEHVPHPADEISAAWRLLAPGGRLLLAVPNGDAVRLRTDGAHWSCLMAPVHFWYFDAASLRSLVERHGFRVDTVRTTTRHYALIEWLKDCRRGYGVAATRSFLRYLAAVPFGPRDGDILRIEATRPS
jgi:SAM-dependent methyltransferase